MDGARFLFAPDVDAEGARGEVLLVVEGKAIAAVMVGMAGVVIVTLLDVVTESCIEMQGGSSVGWLSGLKEKSQWVVSCSRTRVYAQARLEVARYTGLGQFPR